MKEITGYLWDYLEGFDGLRQTIICITTNGYIRTNGEAVMGRGCALEAKIRFPELPKILGRKIVAHGNHVHELLPLRIFSFPVKHTWGSAARFDLIKRSAEELMIFVHRLPNYTFILPKPGCGNGGLEWKFVKPEIENILSDQVYVIDYV